MGVGVGGQGDIEAEPWRVTRTELAEGIGGEGQAWRGRGRPAFQSFESRGAAARSEIRPLDGQACQPGPDAELRFGGQAWGRRALGLREPVQAKTQRGDRFLHPCPPVTGCPCLHL